jgi:hypothetical protein
MGRKQIAVVCESCESPLRSDSPFCPGCGKPTRWATHDERVAWEVRQWRASRAREGSQAGTMMLVRTEAGYEPVPFAPDQFVWDQPLHPEREKTQPSHVAPKAPTVERRAQPQNGNVNGTPAEPIAETPAQPVEPPPEPAAPEEPVGAPIEGLGADEERAAVSKKAIAVAIALVVGLPLGSKVLSWTRGDVAVRSANSAPAHAASGPIRPVALAPTRSGFVQVSPDAARFAVIIRNPNKKLSAREADVLVTFHNRSGRLIGTAVERIASVPAGGVLAVAGLAGVDGKVATVRARVSVGGFGGPAEAVPFVVRGTTVSRSGSTVVVRASVGAGRRVRDARIVIVHVDRAGRILGGDFAFVDVPALPRLAPATVSTSGVSGAVHHVEVYVIDPR